MSFSSSPFSDHTMIGAEEFKPGRAQETPLLQDFEDAEETFSFSNLSLNNRDTYWDTSSNQDRSSPADHGVSFEFCSEELARTASSTGSSDSVIFCGKLIPYKGETVEDETEKNNLEITAPPEDPKKSSVFPPKLSHSLSKSTESTGKGYAARRSSVDQKYNSSVRKVSLLMKTGCRSFKLGVEKFPMEMDLSDIRKRQSRRGPTQSMMFPSGDECDQTGTSSRGKREKILWGLLMVNASLGCIPQVSNVFM